MKTLLRITSPPHRCSYLPDQIAQLEYEIVGRCQETEYQTRLLGGWRRFGFSLFRPVCKACRACQSLRVPVEQFVPNRNQRRVWKRNADIRLVVGEPAATEAKLALYDRFHTYQAEHVGWPSHEPKSKGDYEESFTRNPFPTEEWCYYLGDRLLGVGYVDALPKGLSAIYFFHDPAERQRSLGTFNVLSIIQSALKRGLPHVYLGYYVKGCRSLEYKALFRPNEILSPLGDWVSRVS